MTKLEDKFWDAAIKEAVTGKQPPNQADQILLRLEIPDLGPPKPEAAPKGRVIRLRLFVEVAVAAAALVAIGILTGLIPIGGTEAGNEPTPAPEGQHFASAPGTKFERIDDRIELMDGWLLVTTGAPEVHCEGSVLNKVDGRVLAHAGGAPSDEQAEAAASWLKANNLEMGMIKDAKRWIQAAGMAALVLAGSAYLDGQRIEAQEDTGTAEAKWHVVRTVMDIDRLPDDAKYVQGTYLKGPHLEFLATHKQIERLDIRGIRDLSAENLSVLKELPALTYLDLRDASWSGRIQYASLGGLKSLTELKLDYPDTASSEEVDLWGTYIQPLRAMAERKVQVTIGSADEPDGTALGELLANVGTIVSLDLFGNGKLTDADFKQVANYPALKELGARDVKGLTELGLAYLAEANKLEKLALDLRLGEAIGYQLQKMTRLVAFEYTFPASTGPSGLYTSTKPTAETLGQCLPKMTGLRHLSVPMLAIVEMDWPERLELETLEILGDSYSGRQGLHDPTDAQRIRVLSGSARCALHVRLDLRIEPLVRDAETGLIDFEGIGHGKTDADDFVAAVKALKPSDRAKSLDIRLTGFGGARLDGREIRSWTPDQFAKLPGLDSLLDHFTGLTTLRVGWNSQSADKVDAPLAEALRASAEKHKLKLETSH
ncbi:MAG: hypothetical protein KDB90_14225 [Planctomycetes bacterium]|nr:hypothetical protein [Planctomycetota bacterium]